MKFTLLPGLPVLVYIAEVDARTYQDRPPIDHVGLCMSFDVLERHVEFRGVGLDRLPTILATGVDVEPTTATIFVSDFEKAWEYGGWPKVVMALDGQQLEHTFRELIIPDTTADEIRRLMVDYPTRIEHAAGDRLWLTRLAATDPRAATSYEYEFARWISGNPFDALLAVFIFAPEDDGSRPCNHSDVESGGPG